MSAKINLSEGKKIDSMDILTLSSLNTFYFTSFILNTYLLQYNIKIHQTTMRKGQPSNKSNEYLEKTKKILGVQSLLSRLQQNYNSRQETEMKSDQMEIQNSFFQGQNEGFPDLKNPLKTIVTEMETFYKKQSNKKSPCKFIQDSEYSPLDKTCLEMLKQTTDFMNSVYKFSQLLNFHDSPNWLNAGCNRYLNENDLLNCTVGQIENRLDHIKVEFCKINQLLNRIKKLPIIRNFIQRKTVKLLQEIENIEQDHNEDKNNNNLTIIQLKQKLDEQTKQKNTLQKIIQTTKYQHHNQLSALNFKVDELNTSLVQKQKELKQTKLQLSQLKEIFTKVSSFFEKKLNKKELKPNEFADEIQNYNPPVGMKLIVSPIIHGHDEQRSQIIAAIERFSKKIIKRTDLLCRYPDVKSILRQLRDSNNFAFIVVFKTVKGTIFGSYSEGFRKPTFLFSFTPSGQNKITQVKFYIPQNPSMKIPSVELFQNRYLQYGAGQLRLNCLELATITANSDVKGENYYGLNWKKVMNENNEQKIPLSEVELHRVQFEVQDQ